MATDSTYATREYRFNWHFKNTYDNVEGLCLVKMIIVYVPGSIKYETTLIDLEEYSTNILSGYM